MLYLHDHEVRQVRLNQPHPVNVTPSWYGDSVGHYEGGALVIDTVGVKRGHYPMLDMYGTPFSDALHVVERYTRTSPDVISYEATITDPSVFTRPWKISMPLYRRQEKNEQLLEFKCTEFVEELMYGQWRKNPLPR